MEFESIKDVSGESGATTKIGWCNIKGRRFKCVEKCYCGNDYYDKVVRILDKYGGGLRGLGPDVVWKHDDSKTMYLGYIHSQTVKAFVQSLDINSRKGRNDFKALMLAVDVLFRRLEENNLCHGEPHVENVLVTDDMQLRIVDIDSVSRFDDGDCWDKNILIDTIIETFHESLRKKRSEAISLAKTRAKMQYESDVRDLHRKLESLVLPELKHYFENAW